jgi:predicted nucleic acid-binding protein
MIFVDTTPLVALSNPRDGHHARALREIDRLAARGRFVLCEPNLTEAVFLLDRPALRARLERIVVDLSMLAWAPDDADEVRREVFAWLARYPEHTPDWADGWLAVASGRESRAKVWTYNSEFRTTWRRPDGSKIPLAVR